MANRACLYSDDRPDAAWEAREEGYHDSRWTIPLAWFFFFKPEDVRLVDVVYDGSRWQEVRLSAEKGLALDLFDRRGPLLTSIIGERLDAVAVARFVATVGGRRGRHLLVDPDEVLGGISWNDDDDYRGHAERIARILAILGDGTCPAETAVEITGPYVSGFSLDPDKFECQVLGFTYCRPEADG